MKHGDKQPSHSDWNSRESGFRRAKAFLANEKLRAQAKFAQNLFSRMKLHTDTNGIGDMSLECALCGVAVNEVEGLLQENRTISDIETALQNDICANLNGDLQTACDLLVDTVPLLASMIDNPNSVSTVCVDLELCTVPFTPHVDPVTLPVYQLNLDLPPIQRWKQICSNTTYIQLWGDLLSVVEGLLLYNGTEIATFGRFINSLLPTEYGQEIQGCAAAMGYDYGWITLINIGYEASDACTSIIAQTEDGTILHSRNLDFWMGMEFTDTLKGLALIVNATRGGQTAYKMSSLAGFVGALSGQVPYGFSVTIDTRFYPDGVIELFEEVVAALEEKNATLVALLTRDALNNSKDWNGAMEILSNDWLVADVYYIVAGVNPGEAAVITRNRTDAADIWVIDPSAGRWFEVETNYDHWEPAPWFDDRRDPANTYMNAMGQADLTLAGMYEVMSTKPVLNLQTTYTFLSIPKNGTYSTVARYCPYPCTQ
eukprot:TRINITY_DN468_c0_g2_i2.p1 TRINITY_DN468_c0_g2~~TRINITY_DN468_c0_g2_i2.p1  ORF type:complete len:508 (-),score=112.70 TRINITY_DN468_c0_g2_i2:116-1570(-)